ncbi:MAG: SPOR domain-containing protein [Kangiellaceae bacterium]|nr:SPOR domain-containing protein [Kangiellaceae bacterium]
MENSLKQRIIGAAVLAALAIVFLPAILKEKASNGTFSSKIPAKPQELEEYRIDIKKIDQFNSEKDSLLIEREVVTSTNESNAKVATGNTQSLNQNKGLLTENQIVENNSQQRKTKSKSVTNPNSAPSPIKKEPQLNSSSSQKTASKTDVKNNQLPGKPDRSNKADPESSQKLNDKYVSAAWVVQVASFSNLKNATNLINKLKQNNFKAYRRQAITDGKTVYRVFVGPYINRREAESASAPITLVSETKVGLRIFDPLKH